MSQPDPSTLLNTLSATQQEVLRRLVAGQSVSAAARETRVHRTTVHLWIRTVPAFAQALLALRRDRADHVVDSLAELVDAAINTFRQILTDEHASAGVRLKAAMEIVKLVEAQRPQVAFPESQVLERLHADLSLSEVAAQAPSPHDASPASAERPPRPGPVRNARCVCGSGLKYKRCCGLSTPQARAA